MGNISITGDGNNVAGNNAKITNTVFQQGKESFEDFDFEDFVKKADRAIETLKAEAKKPEHFKELENLSRAIQAANDKDKNRLIETLKRMGRWSLDALKDVGVRVAANMITGNTGGGD